MKNFLFILLLFLLIKDANYPQQHNSPYFLLELGKKWTYVNQETPDSLFASIEDTASIKEKFYYSFAPYGKSPNLPRYWLRPDAHEIFALNMQDTTEYLLFDFKTELNNSWEIPHDSSLRNLPLNQCIWGSLITLVSNTDSVFNPKRLFINTQQFIHQDLPCPDIGIKNTWFALDFGIVRFSQTTESGVIDWDLLIEKPDTSQIIGKYSIIGNPCLTVPCIPGVVSALETSEKVLVLESNGWFWNGEFSWNGYVPNFGDSVIVTGIITNRTDINMKKYYTIEILDFVHYSLTSVSKKNNIIQNFLKQNYPNPFNPITKISYVLSENGNVKIIIYDSLGRLIKTVVDEYRHSGSYNVTVDGKDLSSGIYFYQLVTKNTTTTKTMILLK